MFMLRILKFLDTLDIANSADCTVLLLAELLTNSVTCCWSWSLFKFPTSFAALIYLDLCLSVCLCVCLYFCLRVCILVALSLSVHQTFHAVKKYLMEIEDRDVITSFGGCTVLIDIQLAWANVNRYSYED